MDDEAQRWDAIYLQGSAEALPWNAGGPDADLVGLVQGAAIAPGHALDIGTGPGHDAVYLIQKGFNVVGMDISPTAVKLARERASNAGLFGFFQQGDIRRIPMEDGFVDLVHDRGCFHVLEPADRALAIQEVARVLHSGGHYVLKVFSDKEPPGPGPSRFTRHELETLFDRTFRILDIHDSVFDGPMKPKAYSLFMEKR